MNRLIVNPRISLSRRRLLAGTAAAGLVAAIGPRLAFAQDATSSPGGAALPAGEAAWVKYNLNTITSEQILSIPGTGEQMTHEFDEYRPWTTIDQFRKEIGKYVDDDVIAEYEKYVYVAISPNDVDEATLQQLPGVDEDKASALVSGQPYADNAAFLAALAGQISGEQAALAGAYLATS